MIPPLLHDEVEITTSPLDLQNPWCTLGTMRRYAVSFFCFLPLLINCHPRSPESRLEISEASGVVRQGDELIIVDDSTVGSFFRMSMRGTTNGPLIPLRQTHGRWSQLSEACLALDLEGVDQLADGRLLFLSERMRSLIGEAGLIAEYDSLLGEFANRGLEGVACRPLPGKASRIAVVWEGGYPDYGSVPLSLRSSVGRAPMRPLVVVHDLKPGTRGVKLMMRDAILSVELEVPEPEGAEPEAQRFRAPDLAWSRLRKNDRMGVGIPGPDYFSELQGPARVSVSLASTF